MQNGTRLQNAWFVYRYCNCGNRRLLSTYLWLKERVSALALIPAALSLGAFAWLLSLHPGAAGRTYAAYGGVYVSVALVWLWLIDGQKPDRWDLVGVAITLIGMSIIAFAPRLK